MPNPSFARVKATFEEWAMYDAVVQAGYMHHGELVAILANWARNQSKPLRIVDLGCGDAWLATHAFRDVNVEHYRGVDVSDAAIDWARENLAIWPGRTEIVEGNLADFLRSQPVTSANTLLASYSIHHFLSDAKIALIADCWRVLVAGGTFLWIDAVRKDEESRDAYVKRLASVIQRDWTVLTEGQRTRVSTHVRESDFPETATWMHEQVQVAGFGVAEKIFQGDFFAGWEFVKN
jgi:ubiquinone/menaquinone biosynthesis C-methylase UbiE